MNRMAMTPEYLVRLHTFLGLRYLLFPLWVTILLIVLIVRIAISTFEAFDASVWAASIEMTKIYMGVAGILVTPVVMPGYVFHGMTRHNFSRGVAGVLVGMAIITGTVAIAGFGVEHIVYSTVDLKESLSDTDVFGSPLRAATIGMSFALLNAAYFCSGWLIGSTYYRFDWFTATLLLPLSLIPVMLAEYLVGVNWGWDPANAAGLARVVLALPETIAGEIEIPFIPRAIVVVAVLAGGVFAAFRLVRDMTIK